MGGSTCTATARVGAAVQNPHGAAEHGVAAHLRRAADALRRAHVLPQPLAGARARAAPRSGCASAPIRWAIPA
jgi:hypothetical protein